jgi:hypothetical protein
MPVHEYTITWGATARSVFVHAWDGDAPAVGLTKDTPGGSAAYVREGEGAVQVDLVQGGLEGHTQGGWAEVDPELMPGVYRFGVPDAMLAKGTSRAILIVRFPAVRIDPVEVELVAYDPLDAQRLGMTSLGPTERIAALRGAFPLLAGKEIAEREAKAGPDHG